MEITLQENCYKIKSEKEFQEIIEMKDQNINNLNKEINTMKNSIEKVIQTKIINQRLYLK